MIIVINTLLTFSAQREVEKNINAKVLSYNARSTNRSIHIKHGCKTLNQYFIFLLKHGENISLHGKGVK